MPGSPTPKAQASPQREVFVSRSAFILAAIGSAIGLGNIWRFPYVAYESGGGAFVIPYLIALLTAGIPLLFLDYAIGHKFRASAPLSYRSIHRAAEPIGWFQVLLATIIAIYYSVIVAWAISYTFFSVNSAWGEAPGDFFGGAYLQQSGDYGLSLDFVPGVLIPLIVVWVICLGVLLLGIQNGITRFSQIFIPVLIVLFAAMVVRALFLPGAMEGLNALFTPDFKALLEPSVWVAAYGQIFFSLSVAFGIMLTYASYLKRKTNLTGSGLTVAFSNSGFELLAGVGVFAALGFMAQSQGTSVDKVVESGIGLAFIAFPTLIGQMPGGAIFGILFFLSLVFAGLTSLVSLIQVPIAALSDKLNISNRLSTVIVGGTMAVIACLTMPTVTGLNVLDVVDAFMNNVGIVGIALVSVIVVGWLCMQLPGLRDHLNAISSFKLGRTWIVCVTVITPIVLGYMLISEIIARATGGYGDPPMPAWFVGTFGWGLIGALAVLAILLSLIPWPRAALDRVAEARREDEAEEAAEAERRGAVGTAGETAGTADTAAASEAPGTSRTPRKDEA
ncbi:sodium-dependent transporter [Brevibacterium sp. 5221]|uniref:Transporter n=1 Tax=Brevibacterium rongguiense TaxID=2695267 RepID=A0A6N9HAD6_9MICO|nr:MULTISPECIES: sodium-dependent transporter [Brevibacterium]MYM20484.1 sodium-dependent transporter [Brevibacterium rongguiense]WAL40012.1 sodium-dependent transporter [Brevibacterium sp. BRM-1]